MICVHLERFTQQKIETSESKTCQSCNYSGKFLWNCLHSSETEACEFVGCLNHSYQHFSKTNHEVYYNKFLETLTCYLCKCVQSLLGKSRVETIEFGSPSGLLNLGNTCFINSVIQCLFNIPAISEYFSKVSLPKCFRTWENALLGKLTETLINMKSQSTVDPGDLVQSIYCAFPEFSPGTQQDSQEFLRLMIDKLDTALKEHSSVKSSSFVLEVFKGRIETKVECKNCGSVSACEEDFLDLPVSLPESSELPQLNQESQKIMSEVDKINFHKKSKSKLSFFTKCFGSYSGKVLGLYDCLIDNFKSEDLHEEANLYYCEKCDGKYFSRRTNKIKQFPNVLIVVFKRFKYQRSSSKITKHIELPLSLNLDSFASEGSAPNYYLGGIIQHTGSLVRGHYTAFSKNHRDNLWYEYNDKFVKQRTLEKVLSSQAYIAFYIQNFEARQPLTNEPEEAYLPLEWYIKYQHLANPGPITLSSILCEHNNFSPLVDTCNAVPCSIKLWKHLNHQFSSQEEYLTSNTYCKTCLEYFRVLESRVQEEKALIESLSKEDSKLGPWFFVSAEWMQTWNTLMRWSLKTCVRPELPGPITNSVLFEEDELKSNLVRNKHYSVVNPKVWKALSLLYGFDVEVKRAFASIYFGKNVPDEEVTFPEEMYQRIRSLKIN